MQIPHVGDDLTVTGSYVDGKITLHATRPDGVVYNLADAATGDMGLSAPITVATLTKDGSLLSTPEPVEFKVSVPVVTETITTTPGTESVKNHGQFVKAQGGGKTAAQACAGMPLNSTQGGSILK